MSESTDVAEQLTSEIDEVDRQLLALLAHRRPLVERLVSGSTQSRVGQVADAAGRIETLVANLADTAETSGISAANKIALLKHVSSVCLASIRPLRAAYLGPKHSYSHLAAIKFFGDAIELVPVATIESVFDSIEKGEANTGIVPIENSTDGRVVDTLGIFVRREVKICGEVVLPIHHNLLSRTPRTEITEVQSKPQALSQCRGWLARNLPSAKLVEVSSTTAAAIASANTPGVAAVASIEAGREYELDVIQAGIEDNPNNVTRFAVLGPTMMQATGNDKTAVLFQINHEPGALADAMMVFKDAGLNLTWIESFPAIDAPNEYFFFVELTGHRDDDSVASALDALSKLTQRQSILGSYPRASVP
ncbi:P-protein [Rubripirellula obstinata]|uniref:prephenate dehydratase n=1 Tax=Rubripirellula obstinata TaxID=406547 RepID=A0A5B1CRU5_9BACT|nr:prephenate dehydratase [Rubripirellula obstinata]KAA1262370.1 P-protein [Rubripirellula obstinata]